jgi:dsDNA-specific endonuclease/ATPase MutS2
MVKLRHQDLKNARNEAWQEAINLAPRLSVLRRRLRQLDERINGRLEPLCFVKRQALQRRIQRLEARSAGRP